MPRTFQRKKYLSCSGFRFRPMVERISLKRVTTNECQEQFSEHLASHGTRECCLNKCINVGFDQLRYLCFATSFISQMSMFSTPMDCLRGIWLKFSTSNGLRSEIQTTVTFASSPPIAVHGFAWYLAPRNLSCSTNVPLTLLSSTTPGKTLALVDELNSITSPCRCHPDLCAQLPS